MSALVWVWHVAVAAACDGGEDLADLSSALVDADRALGMLDPPSFSAAVDRARTVLGCVREPVSPAIAASLHRAVGVRAFGDRDLLAAAAFAAARRIEPDATLSPSLFPPNSAVYESWSAIALDTLRTDRIDAPHAGWITLDGVRSMERATELPVVFQRFAGDGTVMESLYLLPEVRTPTASPRTNTVASTPTLARSGNERTPLLVTAATSGAVAATLWGLAAHGRGRYVDVDDPVPDDRLDGLRTRTNMLAVGSLTSVGICAVSGALLVARW